MSWFTSLTRPTNIVANWESPKEKDISPDASDLIPVCITTTCFSNLKIDPVKIWDCGKILALVDTNSYEALWKISTSYTNSIMHLPF